MSLQTALDNLALGKLPIIKAMIESSEQFESNQMRCYTLRNMMDSLKSVDKMCNQELDSFGAFLIDQFRLKGWIA